MLAARRRRGALLFRDVVMLRAPRYIGHNPAGGAMIVALLVALAGTRQLSSKAYLDLGPIARGGSSVKAGQR
jgi:cytochrome b